MKNCRNCRVRMRSLVKMGKIWYDKYVIKINTMGCGKKACLMKKSVKTMKATMKVMFS